MPNHTHLLMKTNKASDFSTFMKRLNLAYFHHFRQKYSWVGHFWQDRFKSQPVGKDEYFIQCGKYIELNAVRAGLVDRSDDYPYSSYRYYAPGDKNFLLAEDLFYEGLGQNSRERQKVYQELIIDDVILGSYKKRVWGTATQRYKETQKIQIHFLLKSPKFQV